MSDLLQECIEAACGDYDRLVEIANDRAPGDFQDPEVFEAIVFCLDVLAKDSLSDRKQRAELKATLEPALERGWQAMRPALFGATLDGDEKAKSRIWGNAGLEPRTPHAGRRLCSEDMLAVGVFWLLSAIRQESSSLSVKRCSICSRFFIDRARDQRAKYCGNACRLKGSRRSSK